MSDFYEENRKVNDHDFEYLIQYMSNSRYKEENGYLVNLHYHNYIEVLYGLKGNFKVCVGLNEYDFKKGDIMFINSKRLHSVLAVSGDQEDSYTVLKIAPSILYDENNNVLGFKMINKLHLENAEGIVLTTAEEIPEDDIKSLMKRLEKENKNRSDIYYDDAIKLYLNELLLYLLRIWTMKGTLMLATDIKTNNYNIFAIVDYINNHYREEISPESVAKLFCMSYSNFTRLFKQYTSLTFTKYVNELRVSNAVDYLIGTNKSITDIAFDLGYMNTSYFIKTFKELKGISPMQFRKSMKGKRVN